jgi:hypothetical protein
MVGQPGKSGAKAGNKNALTTGARLDPRRLVVGELPATMISVKREGRKYRRALEQEVIQAKGEINITDAHHIDTATGATVQAGIARWLLRNRLRGDTLPDGPAKVIHHGAGGDKVAQNVGMTTSEVLACMESISKAKQIRDKAVAALKLDAPPTDPWAVIDAATEKQNEH